MLKVNGNPLHWGGFVAQWCRREDCKNCCKMQASFSFGHRIWRGPQCMHLTGSVSLRQDLSCWNTAQQPSKDSWKIKSKEFSFFFCTGQDNGNITLVVHCLLFNKVAWKYHINVTLVVESSSCPLTGSHKRKTPHFFTLKDASHLLNTCYKQWN